MQFHWNFPRKIAVVWEQFVRSQQTRSSEICAACNFRYFGLKTQHINRKQSRVKLSLVRRITEGKTHVTTGNIFKFLLKFHSMSSSSLLIHFWHQSQNIYQLRFLFCFLSSFSFVFTYTNNVWDLITNFYNVKVLEVISKSHVQAFDYASANF